MPDPEKTIFTDRRDRKERRQQVLSMPAELNRRQDLRREKGFESKPWWLQVDYATELVSAKAVAQAVEEIRQPLSQHAAKSRDNSTKG